MRISQVAARSGVPATTLRYDEGPELLRPQRAPNGYRTFAIALRGSQFTLTTTVPPEGMSLLDELVPDGSDRRAGGNPDES
ncbi:MerR family DNA-binding transcriptional regulator [Rhodococcus triatomae]|uniref:MerR family regulatory protein n=1 Tax=Rhodococcus triatomae TaxID=300028 RepID=A0A1G8LF65_9NOCA|nr:MerR family DNA-binding transcriptional regulator [Rhodococcus triatomae]QNG20576.1 MerR family DNA-binding transcriptional regulator [Rhodococcus triatomae]QNG23506.1 MerR family DNA-binding transcriptional regulator [Rhodococcus triatomae]SDI54316.1 MerR family regulatory protein [Rhodococcus triatomae]